MSRSDAGDDSLSVGIEHIDDILDDLDQAWTRQQYEISWLVEVTVWRHVMPLMIDGGRIPTRGLRKRLARGTVGGQFRHTECIKIALINNMPDAALEDTELQFSSSSIRGGGQSVLLKLFSLPKIPRSDRD